jgi:hypothetical protein
MKSNSFGAFQVGASECGNLDNSSSVSVASFMARTTVQALCHLDLYPSPLLISLNFPDIDSLWCQPVFAGTGVNNL